METTALLELVDQLDGNLENLEDVLKPVLDDSLNATTKKLPILDRAKLNVTVVYAIESLLFSYLRLNGVDAKTHPVFQELERVKQYFAKVKEAEEKTQPSARPSIALNKQAAARIIQHSLATNGRSDMAQRAKDLKAQLLAKRSSNPPIATLAIPLSMSPTAEKQAAEMLDSISREIEMQDPEPEGSEEGEIDEGASLQHPLPPKPYMHITDDLSISTPSRLKRKHIDRQPSKLSTESKAEKKARKKAKKEEKKALVNATNAA